MLLLLAASALAGLHGYWILALLLRHCDCDHDCDCDCGCQHREQMQMTEVHETKSLVAMLKATGLPRWFSTHRAWLGQLAWTLVLLRWRPLLRFLSRLGSV